MRRTAICAILVPLLAQSGRMRVVVTDPTQAVVNKAEVTVACANAAAQRARTDDDGAAAFSGLPPGNCEISAAAPGFKAWRGSYSVNGSEEGRVDVRLAVSVQGTEVVVNGQKPQTPMKRFVNWLTSCTRR